jgi:hypothetical protein
MEIVLGHGKHIFRGAGATPKHVLHASTQVEHRSSTKNSAMRCLWCAHAWHVTFWNAPIVEAVGKFSSGPGCVVGETAYDQAD